MKRNFSKSVLALAIMAITFQSCEDSSTSVEDMSSSGAYSSQYEGSSSSEDILGSSSSEEILASSSSEEVGSSSSLLTSSSSTNSNLRDGFTYENLPAELAGVWQLIGSDDTLHISDKVLALGNSTQTLKNGFEFKKDPNKTILVMDNGTQSIEAYSYLLAGDTLYFNDPGTNWSTFLPNPVLYPVTRTDANTLAYLRK